MFQLFYSLYLLLTLVYLLSYNHFYTLTHYMFRYSNKKTMTVQAIYQTPIKKNPKQYQDQPLTAEQTYQKSIQKSVQSSHSFQQNNNTMNIFKKRKYKKMIKRSNLHLLVRQAQRLQEMKEKSDICSDTVKQLYKQELDINYVVVARISEIQVQKKYYVIYCEDDALREYKFYFTKHQINENEVKYLSKPNYGSKRKIMNLDQLQFETSYGKGTPYFKFFIIFRQIPIYQKSQNEILNSDKYQNEIQIDESEYRKRFVPKIKETQFRAYIEHFEKINDFNYLTWHNMHIYFEQLCLQKESAQKMEIINNL